MTIKEFSEKQGLSKGTIYKAIRNSSFQLNQITNRAGNITPDGLAILNRLFPESGEPDNQAEQDPGGELERLRDELEEKRLECDGLREELKEKERALEKAEDALRNEVKQRELYEKLYSEAKEENKEQRESAERERDKLLEKISEAHRLASQQQELARIASMNPIKRLFSGRKKTQPVKAEVE